MSVAFFFFSQRDLICTFASVRYIICCSSRKHAQLLNSKRIVSKKNIFNNVKQVMPRLLFYYRFDSICLKDCSQMYIGNRFQNNHECSSEHKETQVS